jgi:DNA-binding transcriptional regulator YhcF (GntR family)
VAELFSNEPFRLDRESGVPVGTQLAWHLRRLIAGGRLSAGERLPSVRELAEAAAVNVNTARSVYGRLEEQGYLTSEQGRGTFVAERMPGDRRLEHVERLAATLEERSREAGLDPHEVAAHLYGSPAPGAETRTGVEARAPAEQGDVPAASRRELRAQIAELEARLVRHPSQAGATEGPGFASSRRPAGALLTSEQLREVRDDLRDRLHQAESAREEILRDLRALEAEEERSPGRDRTGARAASPSIAGARVRWVGP